MKINYEKVINGIIEDLVGYAYEDIADQSTEIRELEGKLSKQSQKVQAVLPLLNEESRKTIEEYTWQVECLNGEYNNKIYVQGLKDCVKILKYLKIL